VETSSQYMAEFFRRTLNLPRGLDESTGTRLYTYLLVIKSIDFGVFFLGNGPGFYGKSVDSSILRLIAEVGLIGLIGAVQVMRVLSKDLGKSGINFIILVAIVALSDVFFSARFWPTLFLLNQYAAIHSSRYA
jgi:hypothetical protein